MIIYLNVQVVKKLVCLFAPSLFVIVHSKLQLHKHIDEERAALAKNKESTTDIIMLTTGRTL